VVDAGLAIRSVEKHIGVPGHAEVPVTKSSGFPVEIGANPGHFGLGDAGIRAEGLD
jgi:hypothetical protein